MACRAPFKPHSAVAGQSRSWRAVAAGEGGSVQQHFNPHAAEFRLSPIRGRSTLAARGIKRYSLAEETMTHNIHDFLQRLSAQIAAYLERVLPPLFDDWWNKAVVSTLSFQQKRRFEQRNITSLGGLDLAGLLRILDQNWYQISNSLDLTSDARHFV